MYMIKKIEQNNTNIPTSEVYLIEVNTLKSFLKKEVSATFLPCPEVKKQEILDKATGKKKENASWFLSRQLDMFGESPHKNNNPTSNNEISFLSSDNEHGAFFVNGEMASKHLVKIIKNGFGDFFAVISPDLFTEKDNEIISILKDAHNNNKSKSILVAKEVSVDIVITKLNATKNHVISDLFVMSEIDRKDKSRINVLIKSNMVNSAIKKSKNNSAYLSPYMSCEELVEKSNNIITFHVYNNNILFLPIEFNKDCSLFPIASSILMFLESGKPEYLKKLSRDVMGGLTRDIDLCL